MSELATPTPQVSWKDRVCHGLSPWPLLIPLLTPSSSERLDFFPLPLPFPLYFFASPDISLQPFLQRVTMYELNAGKAADLWGCCFYSWAGWCVLSSTVPPAEKSSLVSVAPPTHPCTPLPPPPTHRCTARRAGTDYSCPPWRGSSRPETVSGVTTPPRSAYVTPEGQASTPWHYLQVFKLHLTLYNT